MYGEVSIEGLELISRRLDSSASLVMIEFGGALAKSKTWSCEWVAAKPEGRLRWKTVGGFWFISKPKRSQFNKSNNIFTSTFVNSFELKQRKQKGWIIISKFFYGRNFDNDNAKLKLPLRHTHTHTSAVFSKNHASHFFQKVRFWFFWTAWYPI